MDFYEAVKIERSSCKHCLSLIYTLPCRVDRDLPVHLKNFGDPKYPLKSVKLLRIDSKDGYKIQSKLDKNTIKFAIPKELENTNIKETSRQLEFDRALAQWIQDKLNITITVEE